MVKLLLKKSPASNMGSQRPVCCVRTVYKLVSAIINTRMYKLLEQYDVQMLDSYNRANAR